MNISILTKMVFDPLRWGKAVDKAELKNINYTVLREICRPDVRLNWYYKVMTGNAEIGVFHLQDLPKDDGSVRTVWIAEDADRVFLSIVNDCLMELFRDYLISNHCKSYLSGIGCQEIVTNTSNKICKLSKNKKGKEVLLKLDLQKYFDTVKIEVIDAVFDMIEHILGCEYGTEPVINVLRKLYHRNLVFNQKNELVSIYGSLMQGCAISGFLADVVLYDVDEMMAEECDYYVRYSDDMMILSDDIDKAKAILDRELPKYGVRLHPNKCERHTSDDWVKFLGFLIRGNTITWSKNRVKNVTKEIFKATLAKPYIHPNQAKKAIKRILYGDGDGYSFATSCFGAINNKKDVDTFNNWVMDAIRLCEIRYKYNEERKRKGLKPRRIEYNMSHIGGLGVVTDRDDYTIIRGKGKKISTARQRTQKEIDNYKSVGCLLGCYKLGRPIYESVVRSI